MQAAVAIEVTNDANTLPPVWLPHDGVEIDDIDDVTILENVTRLTTLDIYPTAEGTAGALHMHLQRGRTTHENHDGDFG